MVARRFWEPKVVRSNRTTSKIMIQVGTKVKVNDNSGAKIASCIKILNGYKRRYAFVGDLIVVSIQSLRSKRRSQSKVKKGAVMKGLVTHSKIIKTQKNAIAINFFENSIVLINTQGKPIGTRIVGGIPRSIRYSRYMRLVAISGGLIK